MAAIGIEQLKRIDYLFLRRKSLAKKYDQYLNRIDKIVLYFFNTYMSTSGLKSN